MKNDTGKTVRSLLIAGVVVMAVSIMWPLLAEKYGTSKQTASNVLQSENFCVSTFEKLGSIPPGDNRNLS